MVCQTRRSTGISSIDADNCYNHITHPNVSMAFQSLGVPQEVAALMLSTIQDMCFFLRTGFGDSTAYAGFSGGKKTQGMCQGNKAVPAGWTVTSVAMIQVHKWKGHGIHLKCHLSGMELHLIRTLFVDDTNLERFDVRKIKTAMEAHAALQWSIRN